MKNLMKLSMVLVIAALAFSSCNCFKKMAKNREDISWNCTPEVLVLNNGIVAADISVSFPAEYYNAKAVVKVTPVMVFEGGEIAGTPKFYQGSKVDDNYTVVDKKSGGKFTQHVEFPYDERMAISELQLRLEIKCPKGKCKEFTLVNANTGEIVTAAQIEADPAIVRECGLVVATGVNTLQQDLKYADAMLGMPNDYKRVTTEVDKTEILYPINSSNASQKAIKSADLNAFKQNVVENLQNDRATQHLAVKGYASPDGPVLFNDKLSKARSESGRKTVAKILKDAGLEIDAEAYGEDWEGFKEMVIASDIKDKNLILQVLSMYDSSAQRESEIKNMASVFDELKTGILPKLRRSMIVNSTDLQGKTDEEMMALVNQNKLGDLTQEELLFVAESVAKDNAVRAQVLEYAAQKYNDARAYNNLGVVYAQMGRDAESLAAFEKAAKAGAATDAINNNLALANLANGNVAEAGKYAKAANAETRSLIAAAEGNYNEATRQLKGYNAAVASTLNNDYAAAKKAIAQDTSADADYLRAVIASNEGDLKTAEAQLRSAISKDARLAKKAARDANLKALRDNGFRF